MPLEIRTLKIDTLPNTTGSLYAPADPTAPGQKLSAIVHGMRFTNTGSGDATIHLLFLKKGGSTQRRLLPVGVVIPGDYSLIDDDQVTLGPGDAIHGYAEGSATVHYVFTGAERPA